VTSRAARRLIQALFLAFVMTFSGYWLFRQHRVYVEEEQQLAQLLAELGAHLLKLEGVSRKLDEFHDKVAVLDAELETVRAFLPPQLEEDRVENDIRAAARSWNAAEIAIPPGNDGRGALGLPVWSRHLSAAPRRTCRLAPRSAGAVATFARLPLELPADYHDLRRRH
jgi:hypothetical protein